MSRSPLTQVQLLHRQGCQHPLRLPRRQRTQSQNRSRLSRRNQKTLQGQVLPPGDSHCRRLRYERLLRRDIQAAVRTPLPTQTFFNSNKDQDKKDELIKQLENLQGMMNENIEKVLQREEKVEMLVKKTQKLDTIADEIRKKVTHYPLRLPSSRSRPSGPSTSANYSSAHASSPQPAGPSSSSDIPICLHSTTHLFLSTSQ